MPTLISRIGSLFGRSSKPVPGRSTGRGKGYISVAVDKDSLRKTTKALQSLEPKVAKKIAATALRKWGQGVRKVARQNAYRNAERTKQQLTYKIKRYKRAVWGGVGVKTERVRNPNDRGRIGRNSPFVGWKSHFYEVGWHAYPRGIGGNAERAKIIARNSEIDAGRPIIIRYKRRLNGKIVIQATRQRKIKVSEGGSANGGRGWRKGVRNRKGVYQSQYARHYLWKASQWSNANAGRIIAESVAAAVREINTGKVAA